MPSPTGKSTVETVQGLLFMCCGVRGNAEVCVVRCKTYSLRLEFGIDSIDNPFLHERIFRLGLLDPHESPVFSEINRVVMISLDFLRDSEASHQKKRAKHTRVKNSHGFTPYVLAAKPV